MGKGHSDRKKINKLISEGKYKQAREVLATTKKRMNVRGQKALSDKASGALERHMESQIKLRRKMGKKKFDEQRKQKGEAIRTGMSKGKEARRQELIRDTRRLRFTGD